MRYRALSSHRAVKPSALFAGIIAAVSLGTVGSARATTMHLDLGTSPQVTCKVTNSFDALNGTALQGQTLSLDFRFSHGEFVRLFTVTSSPFVALLKLQTSSFSKLDFLSGTGFLVNQHGNPMQQPQQLGSASGNNGLLAVGLFPLLPGDLSRPLDFFGIHFDLTLPVSPFVVFTGEDFLLKSDPGAPFGVGPGVPADIVPDSGSTFLLLCLGVIGLLAAVRKIDTFLECSSKPATLARSR
jgi:hypothetical protein